MTVPVLTVDTRTLERRIRETESEVTKEVRKQFRTTMAAFTREHIRSRFGPRTTPTTLKTRSGALRRSFQWAVTGNKLDDLTGRSFSAGVKYARIHEYGGTIVPKRANWLTFPILPQSGVALPANPKVWRRSKRVVIPARLGHGEMWKKRHKKTIGEVSGAVTRGIKRGEAKAKS